MRDPALKFLFSGALVSVPEFSAPLRILLLLQMEQIPLGAAAPTSQGLAGCGKRLFLKNGNIDCKHLKIRT